MEYAGIGDEIALLIVRDAAQHIERFIETIFAKGASRCVLMGGLAPRIKPWLRARVVEKLSAPLGDALDGALILAGLPRSEEHTSELQSLMRISYAVFCLKKKKNKYNHNKQEIHQ